MFRSIYFCSFSFVPLAAQVRASTKPEEDDVPSIILSYRFLFPVPIPCYTMIIWIQKTWNMKILRLVNNQGLLCLADRKTLPQMCGADRRWAKPRPRYQEALPARLGLPQVTWPVSWSAAHPPDLLLFTNQHTVYKSRMKSPAWSIQVSGNYMTTCVPSRLYSRHLACSCMCYQLVWATVSEVGTGLRTDWLATC